VIGDAIRPELARAWQNIFGIKGGQAPAAAREIIPVIVMDATAYVPTRAWHCGSNPAASVGNFSYFSIANVDDPKKQRSIAVIDEFIVMLPTGSPASGLFIGLSTQTQPSLAYTDTADADGGKEPADPTVEPRFGNVRFGIGASPTQFVTSFVPLVAGVPFRLPGPFIVGPLWQFLLTTNALNAMIEVWARGRYYAST
jgi:hypothetical protein